jgi:hypothetical protein
MKSILLAVALLACPLCAGFGGLYLATGLWKETWLGEMRGGSPKKRSPLRDNMLRPAGQYLKEELDSATLDLMFYSLLLVVIPYVISAIYLITKTTPSWSYFVMYLSLCLAGSALPFLKVQTLSRRRGQLRIGLDGELATGEELNQLMRDGYTVYHDLPADHFNVDHVIIGPAGVFAVETKTRTKPAKDGKNGHRVFVRGSALEFPGFVDDETIGQAKAEARWLSNMLTKGVGKAVSVAPVVSLPGWLVERTSANGVTVVNPKETRKLLLGKSVVLDDQTIRQISFQIENRCRSLKPHAPL